MCKAVRRDLHGRMAVGLMSSISGIRCLIMRIRKLTISLKGIQFVEYDTLRHSSGRRINVHNESKGHFSSIKRFSVLSPEFEAHPIHRLLALINPIGHRVLAPFKPLVKPPMLRGPFFCCRKGFLRCYVRLVRQGIGNIKQTPHELYLIRRRIICRMDHFAIVISKRGQGIDVIKTVV